MMATLYFACKNGDKKLVEELLVAGVHSTRGWTGINI